MSFYLWFNSALIFHNSFKHFSSKIMGVNVRICFFSLLFSHFKLSIFEIEEYHLIKTRHLEILQWAVGNCDGHLCYFHIFWPFINSMINGENSRVIKVIVRCRPDVFCVLLLLSKNTKQRLRVFPFSVTILILLCIWAAAKTEKVNILNQIRCIILYCFRQLFGNTEFMLKIWTAAAFI